MFEMNVKKQCINTNKVFINHINKLVHENNTRYTTRYGADIFIHV